MAPPPPHEMHIPHKHHELIPGMNQMRFMEMFLRDSMLAFLSIALAYALKFGERAGEIRSEMLEIKAESRSLEIRNLKAQLNPHFLFNTLNNIYALIAFDSERAQKAVHDLGSMLRFMIYESPASVVPLSNDVAFVKDYIALMQLRLNSAMKLNVDIRTDGMEGLSIAPLILMTIIENAFKHAGISSSGKQFISISITMTSEYELCCKVINSYNDASPVDEEKSAKSIGLKNVSRQLALLYPGRSKLDITTENGIYSTELMINLSSQNLLH
jgi:LytS/YehU family sensor histidine kinase